MKKIFFLGAAISAFSLVGVFANIAPPAGACPSVSQISKRFLGPVAAYYYFVGSNSTGIQYQSFCDNSQTECGEDKSYRAAMGAEYPYLKITQYLDARENGRVCDYEALNQNNSTTRRITLARKQGV